MVTKERTRAHGRSALGIGAMALLLGAWILPSTTVSGAPIQPVPRMLGVFINVPLNDIQEGQYCVAYALASGGSGSLTFDWGGDGGQFFNIHAWDGPQGTRQIAGTNVYSGAYASVRVTDAMADSAKDIAYLNVDSSYDYNDDCEG